MFWKKKIKVPVNNETKEIEVLETWVVSWMSADTFFYGNNIKTGRMEFVVFTDETSAKEFYDSIISAFSLLKDTGRKVSIEKR